MQDILKHCVKAYICELKNPPFMNPFLHRNRMHANRKTYTRKEIVESILKFTALPGNSLMKRHKKIIRKDQTDVGFP